MSGKLKIKLFLDGADFQTMKDYYQNPQITGFTTNPSLMRKAGVTDYESFAKKVLAEIPDRPISFEVFSDDFEAMEQEAAKIASWKGDVYIKIPITNTKGEWSLPLIKKLADAGRALNVTALMTVEQVERLAQVLNPKVKSIVSVFAGRIADSGYDPMPTMKKSAQILKSNAKAELLWASTREVYNIVQAEEAGCHIITVPGDILKKLSGFGKDLTQLSLETVKQFYIDAQSAGFSLADKVGGSSAGR